MSCRDYRSGLMEFARGGQMGQDYRRHVDSCPECAQFLDDQMALSAATGILSAGADSTRTPRNIEAILMAEFESVHRGRRVRVWRWAPAVLAGAVAAALAVVWFAAEKPSPKPHREQVSVKPAPVVPPRVVAVVAPAPKPRRRPKITVPAKVIAKNAEPDPPFLQVPYTLPLAPYERASVMRMELPVSALIAAGMPVATANTGASAQADVVVGEDGRARAFRVISISAVDSSRSVVR